MARPPSPQMAEVISALRATPRTMAELASAVGSPIPRVNAMLDRLRYGGVIEVVDKRPVEHCKRPVSVYALARD